jgi:hypothetical protein
VGSIKSSSRLDLVHRAYFADLWHLLPIPLPTSDIIKPLNLCQFDRWNCISIELHFAFHLLKARQIIFSREFPFINTILFFVHCLFDINLFLINLCDFLKSIEINTLTKFQIFSTAWHWSFDFDVGGFHQVQILFLINLLFYDFPVMLERLSLYIIIKQLSHFLVFCGLFLMLNILFF